ncbi:glycosyltransferase [Gramella jeungdoensis]|uniref:Glycosyltransferase n=1 Tax=Gramella jeungdoensis TaxID=708091 RepID=A0ABT0Z0G1_9FLAO|nr:glycosyltransferase [Gramella jeungdoensis]MCM8569213.1 glycosyltransferase [Gramella jeungdoensis]
MNKSISLLFAYRDRDHSRVFHSMKSLEKQTDKDFHVIFVDYGSSEKNSQTILNTLSEFNFVDYHYVAHPGLLWNKSKAFNYGIWKSKSDYIITADIDLIFHPEFVASAKRLAKPNNYTVFSYAYLQKEETTSDISNLKFSDLKPSHTGYITGSGLYPKPYLEKIHGFDEFYHFYGSEDEDLFIRLENAGLYKKEEERNMLAHQWHPRYPFEENNELSVQPKVSNIRRINLRHYQIARERKKVIPDNQEKWGVCYSKEDLNALLSPDVEYDLSNLSALVDHFINEELPSYKNKVVSVTFRKDKDQKSLKFFLRKMLKQNYQPLISLKEINDKILKKIIFEYRHHNYLYKIENDLRSIKFIIDLRNSSKN